MVKWKKAALENSLLAAAEVYYMMHPNDRVPWRKLLAPCIRISSPPEEDQSPKPAPPEKWGARKKRRSSRKTEKVVAGEKTQVVEVSRSSPTTPLAWNILSDVSNSAGDSLPKKRSLAVNGGGSRKVRAKLMDSQQFLSEENTLLRKKIEEQKLVHTTIIEEIDKLKNLQLQREAGTTTAPTGETEIAERRILLFDLNIPYVGDGDTDF